VSVSGNVKRAAANHSAAWPQWAWSNVVRFGALLVRRPRSRPRSTWLAPLRLGIGAAVALAALAASMALVDAWAVTTVQRWPHWLIEVFDTVTDFGKSVRVLVPIALMLAAIAVLASPALPRMSQRVLAALAVRLGFLFLAIGLPGLVFTIVKRLIGRARPLIEGGADPFIYRPFGWSVEYASLPSGHATDAFAIAVAIGALWPRLRVLMWVYAVMIALSRVVLTAHFPSDVVAGGIVGTLGALLVREWFAARGLAFVQAADGGIRPLPGPSFRRIKRVARQLFAP
jgi:membrane-associated phospholipid phosphatase